MYIYIFMIIYIIYPMYIYMFTTRNMFILVCLSLCHCATAWQSVGRLKSAAGSCFLIVYMFDVYSL